jgi:Bacteriophage Lambda NinG protein
MIRERDNWTCFTCGTSVNPRALHFTGKSMAYFMHAGHYKAAGLFKAVKYSPYNVNAQCENCNIELEGNPRPYAIALEKRYGFGILQTLERQSKLYFDYTVAILERLTAAAKKSPHEYFILYESLRPKEEREVTPAQAA